MAAERPGVGIVGIGAMGAPLARHLLGAGWRVNVLVRRPGAADDLIEAGAEGVDSLAELADRAALILTALPTAPDVREVALGLAATGRALTIVDISTISPDAARGLARELEVRPLGYLDAPVSGGPAAAASGSLAVMVGGERDTFDRARPLLDAIGGEVAYCGPSGSGQVCKACNQLIVLGTIELVAEALATARASGLDPAQVREVLLGGYASSRVLELHGRRMIEGDFEPGGKAAYNAKDVVALAELSRATGVELPAFEAAAGQLRRLLDAGGGDLDHSALIQVIENGRKDTK
jgi:3-hydroxyisobutyrate dehydrogenase-like beta-hydroxyacid dehydrogenase